MTPRTRRPPLRRLDRASCSARRRPSRAASTASACGSAFPEALLGLLTALAADAPEISSAISALVQHEHAVAVGVVVGSNAFNIAAMLGLSAIVAGRVRARHEMLELEGFVGLWLLGVALAVVAGGLDAIVGACSSLPRWCRTSRC
jgi:Ca2+/Na+ antiporter